MNITEIYTSRKLESLIPKTLIHNKSSEKHNPLGKWSSTVFFVGREKR